jgi:hypothetical protein
MPFRPKNYEHFPAAAALVLSESRRTLVEPGLLEEIRLCMRFD